MAQSDVAIPLIQLIALFLPAWAVVMQIFSRVVRETDFKARPTLLPFVSLAFILAFGSLYLFGRAGFDIMRFFIESGAISESGPLEDALMNVSTGSLAFVGMGSIVILSIGFQNIDFPEIYISFAGTMAMALVMWVGWRVSNVWILFGGITVVMGVMWATIYWRDYPKPVAEN